MEDDLFDFIGQYMPLTAEEKKAIADLNIVRAFKKGTVLVEEGDAINEGYFVLNGCLRTYYVVDGEEKTVEFYTETESPSIVSGPDGTRAAHYVDCVEDSVVTVSSLDMENETFENFPRFETLCRKVSGALLEKSMTSFADFKTSSPEERYLSLLETRPDLLQRAPQYQIASYLGITPQSLSRIRKRLAQKSTK